MSDSSEPIGTATSEPEEPSGTTPDTRATSHRQRTSKSSGGGSFWRELPVLIIIALALALLIKTFLVQAFYIPSASMENTLQGGPPFPGGPTKGHGFDRVLVNKLVYDFRDPRRGEIVVFKRPPNWPDDSGEFTTSSNSVVRFFHDIASTIGVAPSGGSDFIKRVIGVGGDTVSCQSDVLSVNGKPLNEPFLYPKSHPCSAEGFDGKSRTVPKGQLFVMGDHRDDSDDSRVNGFVPVHDVVGRAFVVIWPIGDWKTLPVPSTFKQSGLSAAGSTALPAAGGALAVAPVAVIRRRRRRKTS